MMTTREDNYEAKIFGDFYLVFTDEKEISITLQNHYSVVIPEKKSFVRTESRKCFVFAPEDAKAFMKWARLHEDELPRPFRDNLRGVLTYVLRRYERNIGKIFR